MTAQIFNLTTERRRSLLTKGLASLEADVADVALEMASLRDVLDQVRDDVEDYDIDPRARALIAALRSHFSSCKAVMVELDYLKSLLKPARSELQ